MAEQAKDDRVPVAFRDGILGAATILEGSGLSYVATADACDRSKSAFVRKQKRRNELGAYFMLAHVVILRAFAATLKCREEPFTVTATDTATPPVSMNVVVEELDEVPKPRKKAPKKRERR